MFSYTATAPGASAAADPDSDHPDKFDPVLLPIISRRWAQVLSRPRLDQNRELVKDDSGKVHHAKVMEFIGLPLPESRATIDSAFRSAQPREVPR